MTFDDTYFAHNIRRVFNQHPLFSGRVGKYIGCGIERMVFEFDNNKVIKFMPVYRFDSAMLEWEKKKFDRLKHIIHSLEDGFLYDGKKIFAQYYTQKKYRELDPTFIAFAEDFHADTLSVQDYCRAYPHLTYQFHRLHKLLLKTGEYDNVPDNVMQDNDDFVLVDF